VKYFLPDSQDLVDPTFDFERESRSPGRLRQRDDLYTHELFTTPAIDGILVSKGIVDGSAGTGGRYTMAQRQRLVREGAREFFRVKRAASPLPIMGDCGAFTYVREEKPPYSVEDVARFYVDCQFDLGISVDHIILAFQATLGLKDAPRELRDRQSVTLQLARDFLVLNKRQRLPFAPIGVAQGWSPTSYAHAVGELQKMGYSYIALGGMVPLKTSEVEASLEAVAEVRRPNVKLHLLGVSRTDRLARFASLGVHSFDSTSPLRQAFKDETDNYWTLDREYSAVRIPQIQGNPDLQKAILSGKVHQQKARDAEQNALRAMAAFASRSTSLVQTLGVLRAYQDIWADPCRATTTREGERLERKNAERIERYREVLDERPWDACPCDICRALGYHVILFRGAERNRRRGLHNVWVFYRRLKRELGAPRRSISKHAVRLATEVNT
jgi:hypothetical protein